jgi:hypothetical protein
LLLEGILELLGTFLVMLALLQKNFCSKFD